MVLSEKLAALRKEHGYSQLYVAERLQVSRQAISRWEVGSSVPSTENLMELSRLYGVSLDELVGHDEKSPTQTAPERETVHGEVVPQQQKTGVINITKKKVYVAIVAVFITFLCLVTACLWGLNQVQRKEDTPMRYEDMSNGGSLSPDGNFEFE